MRRVAAFAPKRQHQRMLDSRLRGNDTGEKGDKPNKRHKSPTPPTLKSLICE
jgi:hypothetical protein